MRSAGLAKRLRPSNMRAADDGTARPNGIAPRPKISVRRNEPTNTAATRIAKVGNRVVISSAPVEPCSVRSPIMKKNSPNATAPDSTASFNAAARGSVREGVAVVASVFAIYLAFGPGGEVKPLRCNVADILGFTPSQLPAGRGYRSAGRSVR